MVVSPRFRQYDHQGSSFVGGRYWYGRLVREVHAEKWMGKPPLLHVWIRTFARCFKNELMVEEFGNEYWALVLDATACYPSCLVAFHCVPPVSDVPKRTRNRWCGKRLVGERVIFTFRQAMLKSLPLP